MVDAKTLLKNTSDQSGDAKIGEGTHHLNKGATYWFTGLSGAGKSTVSVALKEVIDRLVGDNKKVFILDGDVIRTGLNKGLGFSPEDREENIRRIAEVSKLFAMSGQICLVAFISPYSKGRDFARAAHQASGLSFNEVYVSASLETCEARDVKGLYKKARAGEIKGFTGISDPYEAPENPEVNIDTGALSLEQCVNHMLRHMQENNILVSNSGKRVVNTLIQAPTEEEAKEAEGLPFLDLDEHGAQYLQTIGDGWAFPLTRFMNEMELLQTLHMHTIQDEVGQRHLISVPITHHVTAEQREALKNESKIALKWGGEIYAVIHGPEFYDNRKEEIISRNFGTFSVRHPKAEVIMAQGDFLISGKSMRFFKRLVFNDGIDQFRLTPAEISAKIAERGADAVYAFQVRNPLHNGHVLLLKDTREQLLKQGYKNPILLLHPLGGWCKDDDVPTNVRMHQHQALLDDGTLNPEHTILAVWPSPMYYGGPTEVLWHASSRVNCGITHFITGRDPAGVKHPEFPSKDLYDVWHGQKLLVNQKSLLNGVEVLPFRVAAYHKEHQQMEFVLPGMNNADFDFISGSRMRAMAKAGEALPPGFMSPKGWDVLAEYYKSL
jgi:3'-phosphoadenosine 5'-phosphosulfate synthase